jgi:hypothetical protein
LPAAQAIGPAADAAGAHTMNKAFCREPDADLPPRCPRCGGEGVAVGPETLAAHVDPAAADSLGGAAWWCATDTCPIAYFDALERVVEVGRARDLYWPKDPTAPLCCCHGLTVDDVDDDLAAGTPARVREVVRQASSPGAACATRSPDGRPCVARLQRYWLRQAGGNPKRG